VFEIPAAGGFLLSERTPVMRTLYEEGEEAEFFSSTAELVEKCRYYLENEDLRRQIAQAGHQRCITSGYDVVSRMRQWWADIGEWKAQV
jgi:spore maturation protein CgeB